MTISQEDDNGDAVKGAELALTDGEGKKTTASSDSKRNASFAGLANGDYDLEGLATGYAADSTSLSVEGDEQEATLTLALVSESEDGSSTSEGETANKRMFDNVTSYRRNGRRSKRARRLSQL